MIGTGIQIMFAFLLSIAFQARFDEVTVADRDDYLGTMLATALAAALFIAPVALHRFLFQYRAKDGLVALTNRLSIVGLAALSAALVGAVLLVGEWVSGAAFGLTSATGFAVVLAVAWFIVPVTLRHRAHLGRSSWLPPGSDDEAGEPAGERGEVSEATSRRVVARRALDGRGWSERDRPAPLPTPEAGDS